MITRVVLVILLVLIVVLLVHFVFMGSAHGGESGCATCLTVLTGSLLLIAWLAGGAVADIRPRMVEAGAVARRTMPAASRDSPAATTVLRL